MTIDPTPINLAGEPDDQASQLLRDALQHEGAAVQPRDRFAAIVAAVDAQRFGDPPERRSRWLTPRLLALVAVAVVALGVSLPFVLRGASLPQLPMATPTSPAAGRGPAASSSMAVAATGLPIYYVGRSDGLLHREFRSDLLVQTDQLVTATNALLNVPPLDQGYLSEWGGGSVISAKRQGNSVVVNLTSGAFRGLTAATAKRAVNQLVYTVTAVLGDSTASMRVVVLVDGSPVLPVLGSVPNGFVRQGVTPMAVLQLDTPNNADTVGPGSLTVSGIVRRNAGAVLIRVRSTSGVLTLTPVMGSASADGWVSFSAQLATTLGKWTIGVSAGGESDSRTVTVR